MPLSEGAFPYVDENGVTKVWDGGQSYDVDSNGQVITAPGQAPEVPWWGSPTPAPGAAKPAVPGPMPLPIPTPAVPQLPGYNIQPGMGSMQWEGQYNLSLAQEKRLRELMESSQIPTTRANIDQMLHGIAQQRYADQMGARAMQSKETGYIPAWLPQPPQFQPGGWRQYQTGGLVTPPGPEVGAPAGNETAAIQAIWTNDKQLQQMYGQEHPDWSPEQAVKDWWSWAPQGKQYPSIAAYAKAQGWV